MSKQSFRHKTGASCGPEYPDHEQARRRDVLRLLVGALAAGALATLVSGCVGPDDRAPRVDAGGPMPDLGGRDLFSDGYLRDLQVAAERGADAEVAGDGAADGRRR